MDRLKLLEHKFKAFFFRMCVPLLRKGQKDFTHLDGGKLQKVLFLRPEKIGDMVISLPVFDGLKKFYPHIKISILGSPKNYPLIKDDPRFDKIYLYTKNLRDVKELLKIRREKYDCIVDMICDDSVTALLMAQFLAPGKPSIGVGKKKYKEYYDFNYDHRCGNTGHIIDNTLKLLNAFGIDSSDVSRFAAPYLSQDSTNKANAFFESIVSDNRGALRVGLNLSAGAPNRIWQQDNYIELIRRILEISPASQIILFTIPSERRQAMAVSSHFPGRIELIPADLNLSEVSALIKHLSVLITPDTSLVHIARAFQVAVVGLYTQFMKNFLLWCPFGQETGAVISSNDDNIHDITVEQVVDTFIAVTKAAQEVRS